MSVAGGAVPAAGGAVPAAGGAIPAAHEAVSAAGVDVSEEGRADLAPVAAVGGKITFKMTTSIKKIHK